MGGVTCQVREGSTVELGDEHAFPSVAYLRQVMRRASRQAGYVRGRLVKQQFP
eukprot:CAMPEP_0175360984 /NCGR_PEP_ID=MMETSP0095-20121207/16321_1 /TAXON_ID=311494 /ORGANISM="Alexandrium monilatum, Strain CCMP3105" /LENGTH=52 /DNA_ID=CAMNT_0016658813 /DNA_START=126 /DNA_END=280 /DNA_ORIENTATION=-